MELADYFSDDAIIRQLCKARIKTAKSLNDRQDISRFTGIQEIRTSSAFINTLLPPRRKWAAFRPQHRKCIPDVNANSLYYATLALRESQPGLPWVENLAGFIYRIRQRVFGEQPFTFTHPTIRPELKEANKYRPLCRFSLEDNIINSLLAKYLRDSLDPVFDSSS